MQRKQIMQRLEVVVCLGLVAGLIGIANAQPPQPWQALTIPTQPRTLFVHGANLWVGNEQDLSKLPTLAINGQAMTYAPDERTEGNFATTRVLQFLIPDAAGVGEVEYTLTRNDGQTANGKATLGPLATQADRSQAGQVLLIDRPLTVRGDWNAAGLTVRPSARWSGEPWLIWQASGVIRDLVVDIPPAATRTPPFWSVLTSQEGSERVGLERVRLTNGKPGGAGLYLLRCFGGQFVDVDASADYALDAQPNAVHGRNVFWRCNCRPRAGTWRTGQVGRAMLGTESIATDCEWIGLDRGPSATTAGPPMLHWLQYRNRQRDTGVTIGGSEGVLVEAIHTASMAADVAGQVVRIASSSVPGGAAGLDTRPGVFVFDIAAQKWARITTATTSANGLTITIDRNLVDGSRKVAVGNGCVECTVAHFDAANGKNAVYSFARTTDLAILGGVWDAIGDGLVIHEVDGSTPNQPERQSAFGWRITSKRTLIGAVARPVFRCAKYWDAANPPPWLEYLKP